MLKKSFHITRFLNTTAGFLLLLCVFITGAESAQAQGVANINVTGIPSVINTPFTDQFEENFRNGRYQVIFTYNNTNTQPVDFRFEFSLSKDGREVLEVTSEPQTFSPGAYVFTSVFDELLFRQTFDDVLDQLTNEQRQQVIQGGSIPEGNYILNIRAIPEDNASMISSMPSVNPFSVIYPQAPILVNPSDQANLTLETPVFNWTPVPVAGYPIDYNFLLVEVLGNQTPLQAINSNRAHAEARLTGQNTLVYTPEYLPLEPGQDYAWRVTARSVNDDLPIRNDGESNIRTFTYKSGVGSGTIADLSELKELPLIPGFARLTDLDRMDVSEGTNYYELNGRATLLMDFVASGQKKLTVAVNNLRLQKGSLEAPILMGGSLRGSGEDLTGILSTASEMVSLNDVIWRFGEGVSSGVELRSPDGQSFKAQGRLILEPQGARGTVKATGSPLFRYGDNLVEAEVTSIEASFPEGTVYGKGSVKVLGKETGCDETRFAFLEGNLMTTFRCSSPVQISLVKESNRMNMVIERMLGDLSIDPNSGDLDYSINLMASVGLETDQGQACGASAGISLSSEEGLQINDLSQDQSCRFIKPKIDLGFFTLELHQSKLNELAYDSQTGDWDFEILLGAKFEIPSFGEWGSYDVRDILIDQEGAHFDEIDFSEELAGLPDFDINNYNVKLETLQLAEFLFPIFQWNQTGPGPWDLSFSGNVGVPNRSNYPKCIRGQQLSLRAGKVSGDEVSATIVPQDFQGCSFEFGSGYAFNIDNMAGKFGVQFTETGEEPIGRLDFSGNLTLGQPFACNADPTIEIGDSRLSITTGLEGEIENIIPTCDILVGPFTANVTSSRLVFDHDPGTGQRASLLASADLDLSEGQTASGSFDLNLITGRFNTLDFLIDQPFDWNIPSENPVLTFRLNRAELTEEGFSVDGRQQFNLPSDQIMGTTFDSLLIDIETLQIKRGRILFDNAFAFTAGIDQSDQSLNFQAVELDSELLQDPGLFMGMSGQIQIDSQGIHTEGQADASLKFNGEEYDLAQVDYSDGFRFSIFPFEVGNGQADIMYDNNRIAWLDEDGFHPAPGFFADLLIPEHLPLPTMDIAYLTLKDEGELLVDVTENSDGNYSMSTLPGKTLTLTAPFFNPQGSPSLTNVTLNNVVISGDPTNPEILEGSIEVTVPQNDPMWQLKDRQVPITLKKLYFGSRPVNGSPLTALHLLGDLHLFENDLPDQQQEFGLFIQSNGMVQADLNITGMDAQVPLLPEDKALLKVEGINGTFSLAKGATSPNFDLTIDSGFDLNTDNGISTGAEFDLRLTPGTMELRDLVTEDFNGLPEFDFGVFGLKLNAIDGIPKFNYTAGQGFDFAFAIDADIRIQPAGPEEIIFPLQGFEIRDNGIQIPVQDINSSSFAGLDLPEFNIAGFQFKPLSLETTSPFTFNWGQGVEFDPDVNMSFEVNLPDFEGTGLNPPDGLTFNDVGIMDGFLTGSVEPFQPIGGAEIDITPGNPDSPTLMISEIFGSLEMGQGPNGSFQAVNINLDGELGNLPAFKVDDPNACVENGTFTLNLVESKYFEGTVSSIQPCGYLELGPAQIAVTNADLNFSVSADEQMAELDGGVSITLPASDQGTPVTANGNLVLDLIEGDIKDGSVTINQQFGLDLPHGPNDPLFTFGINQAVLNKDGLLVNGGGNLSADGVQSTVQFNDLLIGFNPFGVQSGNASIATNFAMEVGVQPLSLKLKDPATAMPADNAIDMSLNGDMMLTSDGLVLSGSSTASIRYQGDEYAALEVEYENGFALNVGGFAVNEGRALFYQVENGVRSQDPLAILNQSGFDLGGMITAFLPSRIPLPSEDIAYVDIKDSNDSLLVDVTSNGQTGGYTISTNGSSLPMVIAALDDQSGSPVEVNVGFSLTTDGSYNVTGGSLDLQSAYSLESSLDIPVSLTEFNIGDQGNGIELKAGLKADLPGPLSEHSAIANAVINQNGISQGTISVGTHLTAYQDGITPLYAYDHSGNIQGSQETDIFEAELWGIEAEFGGTNSIAVSGILNSSLILEVSGGSDPIFYTASWSDTGWDFSIDPGSIGDLSVGDATLALNQQDGIDVVTDASSFHLVLNGQISMADVIGEPLDVTIQDLEVGVNNYNSSPSLHFALAGASGSLADQTFSLFEGAFNGLIKNPTITLNGRSIAVSSDSGNVNFLDRDINYQGLMIDTQGGFSFSSFEAQDIELIPEYVLINSLALTDNQGLRLDSELAVTIPAPVDQTSSSTISIYRDDQNVVQVDATAPAFDLEQQYALGDFGHFKLNAIQADIDPYDWESSGIYANGDLYKSGETSPIISFGEAGQITQNPGIGLSAESPYVQFNATGNVGFNYDFSVFSVAVNFDEISTTQDGFEIELSGDLGMSIPAMTVSSSIRYENFIIDQTGVKDTGNIDGTGTLEMDGIASIEIGQFIYEEYENGTDVEIADASEKEPGDLDGDQNGVPTRTETGVTELLCFGPCPVDTGETDASLSALSITIDAGTDAGSGGISGGVQTIFFMKKASGEFELMIDGLNASMMDNFSIMANMHYMNSDDGFLLRAAASGIFSFGTAEVKAAVAGKFANLNGETSYGLFVAAQSDVGIPIIPGVVDLTGAGGGFFWKPDQNDLDMVRSAVSGMGHTIIGEENFAEADSLTFAAQLYASFGLAGTGTEYVIEGSTFLELTSNSFYMDASGVVLGMDGSSNAPAQTLLEGGMSLHVQREPMFINGSIIVDADVGDEPAIVTADGTIEYFATKNNGKTVWGIIGNADYSIYAGTMTGDGEFLASNSGVLLEVSVGFGVDIPILKVNSNVTGSVWMIDDPDFSMPFGAYVLFNAEACLGFCITAEAKAAFVTKRSGGFELYGAVKGCVDLLVKEGCLAAWVSVTESKLDGGFGKGDHNDLVAQAREQRDQFRAKIQSMLSSIDAAKEALDQPPVFSGPAYSSEDVYRAGANMYALDNTERSDIASIIENEVEQNKYYSQAGTLPTSLQNILTDLLVKPKYYRLYDIFTSRSNARQDLEVAVDEALVISDAVSEKLSTSVESAMEFNSDAETAFDNMLSSMNNSPVSNVVKPAISTNTTQSVSFNVDEDLAESQSSNTESLKQEVELLDEQFRQSIAQVEENLTDMQSMLAAELSGTINTNISQEGSSLADLNQQISGSGSNSNSGTSLSFTPSVNALAEAYTNVYENLERYFALEANWNWMEWEWAYNLRGDFISNNSSIQNGISTLNNRYNSALSGRNSSPNEYKNEVYKVAQRNQAILRFSDSNFDPNFSDPSSSSAPTNVNTLYNELITPNCSAGGLDCVRDSVSNMNEDFWYNMHVLGLQEHADKSAQVVTDEVVPRMSSVQDSLKEGHVGLTDMLDSFYTDKAELTAILYNMIDNYINWKEDVSQSTGVEALSSTDSTDYRSRLTELSNDLRPPQIADIQAVPSRQSVSGGSIEFNTFFNNTEISWSATHPGGVIENSINIIQSNITSNQDVLNTSVSVGNDDYLSLGTNTSINIYPFKTAMGTASSTSETKLINLGLRVRGNAGNTATRRSLFYVDVGPDGLAFNDTGGLFGGDGDTSILNEDTSAPEKPVIRLGDFYKWTSNSGKFGRYSINTTSKTYWTSEPETITLKIQAYDPESDISTYEYAIGTAQGDTNVVGWTELQGSRDFLANIPTSQITGQTQLLNMVEGTSYYLSVRVTNGEGMLSDVTESSNPIKYDSSQPSTPGVAYIAAPLGMTFSTLGYSTPVDPVVESAPDLNVTEADKYAWEDAITPEISASWTSSSDSESGLDRYEYLVTTSENVADDKFIESEVSVTEDLNMTYTGEEENSILEDFDTEVYVHVRAVDKAGNVSDIYTVGPKKPRDPTSPKTGRLQAKVNPNDVKLYFTELPYDPETDLNGIQYSLGTSPGATDLRPWPTESQVDFTWSHQKNYNLSQTSTSSGSNGYFVQYSYFGNTTDRYLTIPRSELPEGVDIYINYRSVNGNGKVSGTRATGPLALDESIPVMPTLDVTYKAADDRLHIELDDIEDPETGIASVRYAVYRDKNPLPIKGWSNMQSIYGVRDGSFDLSKYVYFSDGQVPDYTDLEVRIKITNGAGMQRTITRPLTMSDSHEIKNFQAPKNSYQTIGF
ncbi:hypothetical protein ACKGJO_05880 [Gracilimonas sp. Q87]|uniref:hypothetical protein n=1 Tax=Gracilimonas sp. Q87 TaxID=3384766 RepID=UPI0039842C16